MRKWQIGNIKDRKLEELAMAKISVVMPAYNAEKYVGEAISSILNQTYKDFEFIIINDGSTDKTKEVIQAYNDSRIVYLENEHNLGIVTTLNKGLRYATGEYIARMDADDISVKDRLEKQVTYLDKNKSIGLLGTGICVFGEKLQDQNRTFTTDPKQLKAELIFNSCIAHPTVMIRKEILEKNDLCYNEEFAGAEDYCLWWEIAKVSSISTVSDILLHYRIHSSQITKEKGKQYNDMMKKFLKIRFKDIGFFATKDEEDMFMLYCMGEYKKYTMQGMKILINCFNNILICNKQKKYFNQKKLIKIFELATIYSLNNSSFTKLEKKKVYKYAIQKGLFTIFTRLKIVYHRMYI